jgi:hypothetical protein
MSTFLRYLRVQAFVFLCGIVGPIFLVVYFAAQPEPTLKWMYWAGLFITAIDVLIALALTNAATIAAETGDRGRRASGKGVGGAELPGSPSVCQTGLRGEYSFVTVSSSRCPTAGSRYRGPLCAAAETSAVFLTSGGATCR